MQITLSLSYERAVELYRVLDKIFFKPLTGDEFDCFADFLSDFDQVLKSAKVLLEMKNDG